MEHWREKHQNESSTNESDCFGSLANEKLSFSHGARAGGTWEVKVGLDGCPSV